MISFFLPIRKGSKRLKRKNIKSLPGYKLGLTEIKIHQLNKFRKIILKNKLGPYSLKSFEFVVSTDCEIIKRFVKKFQWIKLHNRTKILSSDNSLDKLILKVPEICNGDFILWTHVTNPLYDHNCYYKFLKSFFMNKNNKSAFSADLIRKFIFSPEKKWITHKNNKLKWPRTQDLDPLYVANSCAFIAKREIYLKNKNRLCKNPLPIISDYGSGLDIDDPGDFDNFKKSLK